jgi:hypothetical protein
MFRKSMAAVAVAALLTLGGASAAFAQDTDDSNYTPRTPVQPTLAGSTALAQCVGDVPWISYHVVMTDPDGVAKDHEVRLVLADGSHTYTLDLGPLVHDELAGKMLWPGAKTDASGTGVAWPGWELVDGEQTQTGGNLGWTRGKISATLVVNPELTVPLSYPAVTSGCATPSAVSSAAILPAALPGGSSAILPVTGLNVPVIPIAIGGGIVLLAGAGLLLARRLRRS